MQLKTLLKTLLILGLVSNCFAEGFEYTQPPLSWATTSQARIFYPYRIIVTPATVFISNTTGTIATLSVVGGGGGSGTPAAPPNSIQYNNAGVFGGNANLTWTNGSQLLTIHGIASTRVASIHIATCNYIYSSATSKVGGLSIGNSYSFPTDAPTASGQIIKVNAANRLYWTSQNAGGGGGGGTKVSGSVTFIFDGGGSSIATNEQAFIRIPYNFTAKGWTVIATPQTASISVVIYKTTLTNLSGSFANSANDISGGSYPKVNNYYKATNPDVSVNWTTQAFNYGDIVVAKVKKVNRTTKAVVFISGTHPTF